jgi:hypothetical protein
MCVEDVRDGQRLLASALNEHVWSIRRINQDGHAGVPISQQISEVPVTTRTNLFEYKRHEYSSP